VVPKLSEKLTDLFIQRTEGHLQALVNHCECAVVLVDLGRAVAVVDGNVPKNRSRLLIRCPLIGDVARHFHKPEFRPDTDAYISQIKTCDTYSSLLPLIDTMEMFAIMGRRSVNEHTLPPSPFLSLCQDLFTV
jgi:hypothetical protein